MEADRARPAHSELADESDADLLVYMTMAGHSPDVARAAWEAFYCRHRDYLFAVCLRAYGPVLGGEAGACDLVADTFKRVYENASKFDTDGIADQERLRWRVRGWLGRIAQRLAQTALRGRSKLPTRLLDQDQWQEVPGPAAAVAGESARIDLVRQAIGALSDKEQTVIRVTFQWYEPGREHQRLPNDVAADLAATLKTTPENLRQIRRRALRKIEEYLRQDAGHERKTSQ